MPQIWFSAREFFVPPGELASKSEMAADKRAKMAFLAGSTVQCVNVRCEARGHWVKAELLGSENCPNCGESLRSVPLFSRLPDAIIARMTSRFKTEAVSLGRQVAQALLAQGAGELIAAARGS